MGKLYLNEEEYGGGTNVVANPSGTATATLQKLTVGTSIYEIPSGASDLDDLTDVAITTPSAGQVLKYNSSSSKWENSAESGGTTVVPNPSGTATETLTKVQIGTSIYDIPSGGGSFESEVIYQNSDSSIPSTIILDKGISNYDAIVLSGYRQQSPTYWSSSLYLSNECVTNRIINLVDDTMYAWYTVTNDTTLTSSGANIVIDKIYGVKFGSGGGGSYSETELYVNSGTGVGNITLSDDFTNYDEICFDCIRVADSNRDYHLPHSYKTSILAVNGCIQLYGYNEYISFDIASTTSLSLVNHGSGTFYIKKVIGIKY